MSRSHYAKSLIALIFYSTFLTNCTTSISVPPINTLLPAEAGPRRVHDENTALDFYLDGTLSMQGFARPTDGRFSQLLLDLDQSFAAAWKPEQVTYSRFGSILEPMAQRPFYVAASNERFFLGTKEYATTRIDKVFRAKKAGHLSVVMTDLFEQDLDVSSIEQSLRTAEFPERSSLAIWQWSLPFSGPIFDFDFRVHEGRNYAGSRYLYMLALGSEDSIEKLRASIDRSVTIGKPKFLLLSNEPVKGSGGWFAIAQSKNVALKSRSAGEAGATPYTVYRTSRGCSTAEVAARPEWSAAFDGAPVLASPGTYKASLRAVTDNKGSWSLRALADPEVRTSGEMVRVEVNCAEVAAARLSLLTIRRVGTGSDLVLPPWVGASSATVMEFNNAVKQKELAWGQKTLNLLPFVRGLASTATERSTIASTYIYLVAN